MTQHIEEARKLALEVRNLPAFYQPEVIAAAIAAAEKRGRIEERDRLVEIVKRRMAVYQTKESASDFLQEPSNSNWDMYRYTREAHEWLLDAITKEPTP